MLYHSNPQELLKHWALPALQDLAAGGHRLRFDQDSMACMEACIIDKVDEHVGVEEPAQLLLRAHSVAFARLQTKLVPVTAKLGTVSSLREAFGEQQPLFAIVQSLRTELDSVTQGLTKLHALILSRADSTLHGR